MSKHTKFLNLLENEVINFPKIFRVQLGAMLVYRNVPIAFGKNHIRTDPFQARYSSNKFCIHLHAEINAIKKAIKRISPAQLKDCTMYVVRLKWDTEKLAFVWAMSKPCAGCQQCLAEFGIRKIVYTTEDSGCAFL